MTKNKKKIIDEIINLLERKRITDKIRIEILLSIIKIYEDFASQEDIKKRQDLDSPYNEHEAIY